MSESLGTSVEWAREITEKWQEQYDLLSLIMSERQQLYAGIIDLMLQTETRTMTVDVNAMSANAGNWWVNMIPFKDEEGNFSHLEYNLMDLGKKDE